MSEGQNPEALTDVKLRAEIAKLEGEVVKLSSENSALGKLARLAIPVVSAVIAALLGFIGITFQNQQSALRDREVFLKLLELATKGESEETPIAGIGALALAERFGARTEHELEKSGVLAALEK